MMYFGIIYAPALLVILFWAGSGSEFLFIYLNRHSPACLQFGTLAVEQIIYASAVALLAGSIIGTIAANAKELIHHHAD